MHLTARRAESDGGFRRARLADSARSKPFRRKAPWTGLLCAGALLAALLTAGCASVSVDKARANFYAGRLNHANENLKDIPRGDKDEILMLCERGMIRQNLGLYDESSRDWRDAMEINDRLAQYSLSRQTASFITNDKVLAYRGLPFERTILYSFLAKNYLAQSNWDYAAICARNIISHLENLNGFPDISYSRYLAAFCLELINDSGNAAIQYRAAAAAAKSIHIDTVSGNLIPAATNTAGRSSNMAESTTSGGEFASELVCFIGIGKMPKWCLSEYEEDMAPYADIYCGETHLGRSYPLSNTANLMSASRKRLAALQATKDASRLVVKEVIAETIGSQNQALGDLTRLILFSLEEPDTRCWETLPLWLEVARVPCPAELANYRVEFKTSEGVLLKSKTIANPISQRGRIFISFCRDLEETTP